MNATGRRGLRSVAALVAGASAGLVAWLVLVPWDLSEIDEQLSERELEVLQLMAAGRSNREIAEALVVVVDTVKKHVGRVMDKLGAANRTQAVTRARELGLLP
jgi:ATP/maltotriose-dependent transcriptional regulator MalT